MFVVKRDGVKEPVSFDKITKRITTLCKGLASQVDPVVITQKVNEAPAPATHAHTAPTPVVYVYLVYAGINAHTCTHTHTHAYRWCRACTPE